MNYSNLNDWIRKNLVLMLGMIVIFAILWYQQATIEPQKAEVAKKCNVFWKNQIKLYCPMLAESDVVDWTKLNLSETIKIGG